MNIKKIGRVFFTIIILLCFYTTRICLADETLFSNGFEDGIENWKTNSSTITFTIVSEPISEGTYAASILNSSSTSFGIEQGILSISENTDYLINGKIKINDPPPSKAFIRVAWYSSTDATGSQIKTDDSEITSTVTDWKLLSFVAKSPSSAHSAKIRLLVSTGSVLFDNVSMSINNPTEIPQQTPTIDEYPTITPSITNSELNNIYISEVMTYPDSGQTEWIELYNNNNAEITLTDWYIDDIENAGSSPKKITLTIGPHAYGIFDLTSSLFNNDADDVRLLDSEENVKDFITYASSQKNYSFGKTVLSNASICIQNPSKGHPNNPCTTIQPTLTTAGNTPTKKTTEPTPKKTPTPTSGVKKLLPTLKIKQISTTHTSHRLTDKPQPTKSDVLGATTEIPIDTASPRSLISTLTILAFSYSILSIISIITKLTLQKRAFAA